MTTPEQKLKTKAQDEQSKHSQHPARSGSQMCLQFASWRVQSSALWLLRSANGSNIAVIYNTLRLHSAIGYVTPQDMLAGRQAEIHAARDRKLEQARNQRQLRRQQTTFLRLDLLSMGYPEAIRKAISAERSN